MEKANPRGSAKNSNLDPKVKQDVTNKHLRLPRVKESVSPRPETRRKQQNPQRNRELFDKRPRNRAGAVYERYRNEVMEEPLEDVFGKQGSKKVNLNHLLNFTVKAHETNDVTSRRTTCNRNKHPKYNKELFLQANCQFVARDDGDYSVHEINPDILVEWSLIEEIRLPSNQVPLCPICLFEPIAAKITRCGHIYCWPCILHYLALTDRTWQKCPICFEAVHKTELKSVSLKIQTSFNVGDEITMYLMKRIKGSLLITPVIDESPKRICSVNTDDNVARFQKLLLADKKNIFDIIKREQTELRQAYEAEKNSPEACFVESALKLLEEREKSLYAEPQITSSEGNEMPEDAENAYNTYPSHIDSLCSSNSRDEFGAQGSDDHCSALDFPENTESTHNLSLSEILQDSEKKGISYFYQAEDGQHIYMHNMNVRMLLKEYGALEYAPPIIKAKVVDIESVSMVDNLRKRLRYLQHLPLTCEFQIVEMDFSQLLHKSTLLLFEDEINKKKHFRKKKAQDEKRRERFIEIEERKKLGKYPKATYNLQSNDQFPTCHKSNFLPLTTPMNNDAAEIVPDVETSNPNYVEENNSSSAISSVPNVAGSPPITSFAQMLKEGQKTQAPTEKKTVERYPSNSANADSDDDNWTSPPAYNQSFGEAMQAALDSINLQDSAGNGQKSGKKKKGKKQVLFTTSMCRKK